MGRHKSHLKLSHRPRYLRQFVPDTLLAAFGQPKAPIDITLTRLLKPKFEVDRLSRFQSVENDLNTCRSA